MTKEEILKQMSDLQEQLDTIKKQEEETRKLQEQHEMECRTKQLAEIRKAIDDFNKAHGTEYVLTTKSRVQVLSFPFGGLW